ncbi:PREDICTED: uncharacterized protein LOC108801941, partial [Nanorana parkeri]|uniref:uncharacterized protein LOC108801941 n=1 Tax=Nanorana parkeri TaxID=125878 RepID=UPI0008547771
MVQAQLAQHTKGKKRQQKKKFSILLSRTGNSHTREEITWREKEKRGKLQNKEEWVENLSDRVLTQPEMDVLAKGLNFTITPRAIPVVDIILATEASIHSNKVSQGEAEQLRLKVKIHKGIKEEALITFKGITPRHWFRYVDETWVKIHKQELQAFTDHINSHNIKFTLEDMQNIKLGFLDCLVTLEEGRRVEIEVYRKPTHTDQYLLFYSHHPLDHKLGVIRTLHHQAEKIPTRTEAKIKEFKHLRGPLKTCGYPDWALVNTEKRRGKNAENTSEGEKHDKRKNLVIPYVAGVSEKLRRVF